MLRSFDLVKLTDLASEQWGLITTRQAGELGASGQQIARMSKSGALERLSHGVYRVAGSPSDRREGIRAAWLQLDPAKTASERRRQTQPAIVSHRSAANLHHLGDVDADVSDLIVQKRTHSRNPDVRFRVRSVQPDDWTILDGLPVTTVSVTIADLAADRLDSSHLAGVVVDALTVDHLGVEEIAGALHASSRHYGVDGGMKLVRRLLDEHGIPETTRVVGEYASFLAHSADPVALEKLRAVFTGGICDQVRTSTGPSLLGSNRLFADLQWPQGEIAVSAQDPTA